MFPIYPGFEDLSLRVEVDWRGQTRTIVARLEQWPDSEEAVLVCSFEGNKSAGEWFIITGKGIYCRRNPNRLLRRYVEYNGPRPQCKWRFSSRGSRQIKALITRAFHQNNWGARPVPAAYLSELPGSPRVVIKIHPHFLWCPTTNWHDFLHFKISNRPTGLSYLQREDKGQLLNYWKDRDSDARFAWQWASLSRAAKSQLLTGYEGDITTLTRLMREVLLSSDLFWRHAPMWHWRICIVSTQGRLYGYSPVTKLKAELDSLSLWESALRAHFMPLAQPNLLQYHSCIEDDLRTLGQVFVRQPPTAHEQLEAKLALRGWLRDKATPDVAASLLASLES